MVAIRFLTKSAVMTPMVVRVSTSTIQPLLNFLKSSWHISGIDSVRPMGKMVILTNVSGSVVVPTVVPVVTERLHANLLTLMDIVISYASALPLSFDDLECIGPSWYTMF